MLMAKKVKHPKKPLKGVCAACGELKKSGMLTAEGKKFCNKQCRDGYKKK